MIDILDVVRPGDRVDLEVLTNDENEKKYHITKVYDVTDAGEVEVVMPMEQAKLVVLSVGMQYDLFFYAGRGIYSCTAEVISRRTEENIAVAVMEPVSELSRRQRREYYRYSCALSMLARTLPEWEEKLYLEQNKLDLLAEPEEKGVIVDISGGGIRFVSRQVYELGRLVHTRFTLDFKGGRHTYDAVVRIITAEALANQPANREYRGQFLFMENGAREEIIRFIFEEERKVRKRQTGV
ncbi:MAG: flagellar brake protein [Lachnospiraceae bacterium]|nr:flagellar brake protein [Lachnospiraceae bacterium]